MQCRKQVICLCVITQASFSFILFFQFSFILEGPDGYPVVAGAVVQYSYEIIKLIFISQIAQFPDAQRKDGAQELFQDLRNDQLYTQHHKYQETGLNVSLIKFNDNIFFCLCWVATLLFVCSLFLFATLVVPQHLLFFSKGISWLLWSWWWGSTF